jgi:hypothetical protein
MATLVLGAVGSAVGGALVPGGVSVLGTTIAGTAIGGAIGSVAGAFIDQALSARWLHPPARRASNRARVCST